MNNPGDIKNNLGSNCWLGYRKLENSELVKNYAKWCSKFVIKEDGHILISVLEELSTGIQEMLGFRPVFMQTPPNCSFIKIGTLNKDEEIESQVSSQEKDGLDEEGFLIKTAIKGDKRFIIITSKAERGLLYGVFCLLRRILTESSLDDIYVLENPKNKLRIINHWDNMDGSVERGYAGRSIFFDNYRFKRNIRKIKDYARLLSSVYINGIVINNVNVHLTEMELITREHLPEVASLADIFGNYGIKFFLSINYASPMEIGGLSTADPLDKSVKEWWRIRVREIYDYIPDFGGFLVKADSEFRPGPHTYGRDHAEGANMLAEALEPFGGIVIWRCFVYNCQQDWRDRKTDRAKAAYDNFKPLDGEFRENVILQIKNGPMDFQVREPVSPLFGGLLKTNQLLEFQITQEYTGQQKHLCCLIPMWKDVLDFDTFAKGKNSNVKKIAAGTLFHNKYGGIAGVVNIGDDPYWTGHQMAQSNLYGFGRLTWNPNLSSKEIIEEWVRMTYTNEPEVVETIGDMLLKSWRIYENYTSPLGIGWMVNPGKHYGPNPDGYEYSNWGTYHRADIKAIGVDRTQGAGTGFTGQYCPENAEKFEKIETCPEELLLFFHRVPYTFRLKSGETLIQYIYNIHFDGVEQVMGLRDQWLTIEGKIPGEIFEHVLDKLEVQIDHAKEWRDVINSYFLRKTGIGDEFGREIF